LRAKPHFNSKSKITEINHKTILLIIHPDILDSFIPNIERHQPDVIEKILRHCNLWKEEPPRPPPPEAVPKLDKPKLD
jgi:hypothetical protein